MFAISSRIGLVFPSIASETIGMTRLELHRLRSENAFTIHQLHTALYELLTATPIFYKGLDMPRLAHYSNAKAILYGTEQPLSKQIITDYIHLADPDAYYNMLDQKSDPTQSFLLSCPCSIYVRTSASVITNVNRQTLRVSESIPYREWKSIEVQRDRMETNYSAVAHYKYAGNLGVGVDGQTGEARRNMVYLHMVVFVYKHVPPSH
ncbi:MAG: hypothetical protein Q9180_007290 [Flavoplaca navasiana]